MIATAPWSCGCSNRASTGCVKAFWQWPTRMVESLTPPLFGLLIDRMGPLAVAVSAGLCLFAFALLWLLRPAPRVGGRAGSERLTITEEVEPMRTRLFLVFALLLAMLPIPHLRRASPQARSERC